MSFVSLTSRFIFYLSVALLSCYIGPFYNSIHPSICPTKAEVDMTHTSPIPSPTVLACMCATGAVYSLASCQQPQPLVSLAGLGSNTFYQIQIQIQIHFFPKFQIQIQIQIHRQKSDQIQIQIQIQLIKYKYKYKYTMRPRQNCRHFTDDILKFIVL